LLLQNVSALSPRALPSWARAFQALVCSCGISGEVVEFRFVVGPAED
jgi:hypothetical protein